MSFCHRGLTRSFDKPKHGLCRLIIGQSECGGVGYAYVRIAANLLPEMKFSSIRMSIRSLPSIRKVYRLVVSAVSQVYQRVTQGSPKKILQSTKLVRVYCGSIPISLRDLRSILNDLPKSTKCILNLRDIPNSLRRLKSIPNDLSEYTKSIRKVYYSIRFHGIFDSYIISFQPSTFPLPEFPTLLHCSHLFAFLHFLTGPNIPYQRSEIHRATDGSGSDAVSDGNLRA